MLQHLSAARGESRFRGSIRRYAGAALLAGLMAITLGAQSYQGGIRGSVTDPQGAVIASAKVTLTNDATGEMRSTLTNSAGGYDFTSLLPAGYTISAESPSFKKFERKNVVVGTQEFLTIDIKLEVGSVAESVLVTEEVPLIEASNASQGQELDNQKLVDLPNLGRNPFMMSKLAQNVIQVGNPAFNRMEDQSGSSQISIAGGPIRGNNYLMDGVPITDATNRAIIIPSIEAVQEVKIQANTYDAEMARTGGGMFNTFLRTGGNTFHGSLYGHLRRTAWDANSYFSNEAGLPVAKQPNDTFGASLTGRIWIPKVYDGKNKTFFMLAWEDYDDTQAASSQFVTPTAAELGGNFSGVLSKSGSLLTIKDPVTHVAYPNNMIPTTALNPIGLAIAETYMAPQSTAAYYGAQNITSAAIIPDRASQKVGKLDEDFFSWWRADVSYARYFSLEPGQFWFKTISSPGQSLLQRRVDATAVNNTFTLSPTTVLTVRYGFNRFPNYSYEGSQGYNLAALGFPQALVEQIKEPTFPIINMNTAYSLGTSSNSYYVHASKNFSASVAKYQGNHSLKAGFDYRRIHAVGNDFEGPDGQLQFTFNGKFSGSDISDLLLGVPYSGDGYLPTKLNDYADYYGFWAQDDYRLSSKLTVNYGLRLERELGLEEANNGLVTGFNTTATNPLAQGVSGIVPRGEIEFAGLNEAPLNVGNFGALKWGPRAGLAWQVNSKTTVRGGFGLFWAPQFALGSPLNTPGYTSETSYIATTNGYQTPAGSLSNPFPSGLTAPLGNTLGALTGIGQTLTIVDPWAKAPRVEQYSFDLQRELPWGIALEVGYVGSHGTHLGLVAPNVNLNALNPNVLASNTVSGLTQSVANPFYGNGGTGVIGTKTVSQVQLLLPFPTYGAINLQYYDANHSRYDSMIVKAQKRLGKGLTMISTFTWSRSMDESSGGAGNTLNSGATVPENPYNLAAEYSLSNFNTPVNWVMAATYELPFGKSKAFLNGSGRLLNYAAGGWSLNTVSAFHGGFPLQITQSPNVNSVFGYGSLRPNATGTSPATSGSLEARLTDYINPAAFSAAAEGTFGNVARTITERGPGMANWDISLFKSFDITEKVHGQFRAEALNAFNTPLFYGPNVSFGSGSFGQITSQANFSRQLQLALRFTF